MSKQIPLTQGQFATVDDGDFDYLNQWKWFAKKDKHTFYACRGKTIYMHREITRCPDNLFVDHKDNNGLNNQKENLRTCTITENNRNRKMNNKTGYRGVQKNYTGWVAQILIDKKVVHLGTFNSPEEAARSYDDAAKTYHGEYAVLNFG